jgi:hypothetical protein
MRFSSSSSQSIAPFQLCVLWQTISKNELIELGKQTIRVNEKLF